MDIMPYVPVLLSIKTELLAVLKAKGTVPLQDFEKLIAAKRPGFPTLLDDDLDVKELHDSVMQFAMPYLNAFTARHSLQELTEERAGAAAPMILRGMDPAAIRTHLESVAAWAQPSQRRTQDPTKLESAIRGSDTVIRWALSRQEQEHYDTQACVMLATQAHRQRLHPVL